MDGERTEQGGGASEDEWADDLLERARARSAEQPGRADRADPAPMPADIAPGEAEAAEERRPAFVTFEDLHGSSDTFPPPGEAATVRPPEPPPHQPPPAGGGFQPPQAAAQAEAQGVDLGIPGTGVGIRRSILEWGSVIVGALVMALLVKTYLFQAFYIPSPSMEPTLGDGDRIIVNKLSYRLHDVNRGDVVVFKAPPGSGSEIRELIKRVIALPGETVSTADGRVRIDGGLLLEPYLPSQDLTSGFSLPPGCDNPAGTVDACLVPAGHVFVMGDNRTNSRDGRFFGPIPEESILGRAFLRVWPLGDLGRL